LDKRTRGFIEKSLDEELGNIVTEDLLWFLNELPMRSPEEFGLGYVLGYTTKWMQNFVLWRKITGRKKDKDLTEKEVTDIRNLLRRRFSDFMEEIVRELNK
jgi:hypothetical protein